MTHSILIIENEPVLARNLRNFFERAGHTVRWADTAREGERQIEACRPDLVVLTHEPPHLDGIGLLRRLKLGDPELPVVIVSAEATVERAVEAIKLGATEFLTKPVALARLRHAAESVFGTEQAAIPLGYFRLREDARMRANGRR